MSDSVLITLIICGTIALIVFLAFLIAVARSASDNEDADARGQLPPMPQWTYRKPVAPRNTTKPKRYLDTPGNEGVCPRRCAENCCKTQGEAP